MRRVISCRMRSFIRCSRTGRRRSLYPTSDRGKESKQECSRGDQVEYAIDTKAYHKARAQKRPGNRAKPKEQDEPATHGHDPLAVHAVVRVRGRNRVECR